MNADMNWFKESTLPEYIRFPWLSRDFFYGTDFFSSKVAPGFGWVEVDPEALLPHGGERQTVQRGQRW